MKEIFKIWKNADWLWQV